MRIITFQSRNCHSSPLVSKLKLNDKVHLENVLLISKFINSLLPPVSNNWFTFCSNVLNYEITSSAACKLFKPSSPPPPPPPPPAAPPPLTYAKKSITVNAMIVCIPLSAGGLSLQPNFQKWGA